MLEKWTPQRLQGFAVADDLQVSPLYDDGRTCGTPTWVWSVVVGEHLYARAWNGQRSSWYQAAIRQQRGRIHLAGCNFQVRFAATSADSAVTEQIDAAYRQKYAGSGYLLPMLQAGPQSATVEIQPI